MPSAAQEPFTRGMIIRATLKALVLFALFNLVYGAIQPVANGLLPSLYNKLIPGRTRLVKGYEYDAYRLVSDHVVSRAQADTFNIVLIGSSEIWGSRTTSAESVPAYLNQLGLVAADGRSVRVYNLGYPFPNGIKDLILLEVLVRKKLPIDLIVVSTFHTTLSPISHAVTDGNRSLELSVIDHYNLNALYDHLVPLPRDMTFLPSWNDRDALAAWASMQARGVLWGLIGDDVDPSTIGLRSPDVPMTQFLDPVTAPDNNVIPRHEIVSAFAQFSHEYGIPLIILEAPVPMAVSLLDPWLATEAQQLGLSLINCWNVYPSPDSFSDFYHIRSEMHEPYAHLLAQSLSDTAFGMQVSGLPLRLPANFVPLSNACALDVNVGP